MPIIRLVTTKGRKRSYENPIFGPQLRLNLISWKFWTLYGSDPREVCLNHPFYAQNLKKVDFNERDEEGITPLHRASGAGRLNAVKLLVARHAKVNMKDNEGETPLFWGAGGEHEEVVKFLLAHKAEVNIQNKKGVTPLHRASGWAPENSQTPPGS